MKGTPVLELSSARVFLEDDLVLDDIDFHLAPSEFLALLGGNGSGKTTLVRAALGLVPLDSGTARIFNLPISRFQDWHLIGYVPQRPSVASGAPASVREVVLSGRIARSKRLRPYSPLDREAAERAMERLGVANLMSRSLSEISGGQQQRVLIARALAGEPQVLLLDEPVSGVDIEHQEKLAESLKDFVEEGGSVLLVAHSLGPMEELVSREVVLHAGKVTYEGPHQPDHVHLEHVHHPEDQGHHSPLDRAAGR